MTEFSSKDEGSEPHGAPQSGKLPVPRGIRTYRGGPRVAAVLISVACLFIVIIGTKELRLREEAALSSVEHLLKPGERAWTVVAAEEPEQCLGLFQTSFETDPVEHFYLEGKLAFSIFGEPIVVSLGLDAQFNASRVLEDTSGFVVVGQHSFRVASNLDDNTQLLIDIAKNDVPIRDPIAVSRPSPILLVEIWPGQFALRFPPGVDALVNSTGNRDFAVKALEGLEVVEAPAEQIALCQARMADPKALRGKVLLDLGQYVTAVGGGTDRSFISDLFAP